MTKEEFINGQTLLVDKPVDWTSFDVVNKIRYPLKKLTEKKNIKVGHAGTLDPFATGLLVICTGKATKTIDFTQNQDKEYVAEIELGKATDSQDVTGEITEEKPVPDLTKEQIQETINQHFIGAIEQLPPMFSAIKVDGVRLYKHARKGVEVERKIRNITINSFDVMDVSLPYVTVRINSSKGTYVRTLAHDLGEKLGTVAYCKQLRRTKIGDHSVSDARTVDELVTIIQDQFPTI